MSTLVHIILDEVNGNSLEARNNITFSSLADRTDLIIPYQAK